MIRTPSLLPLLLAACTSSSLPSQHLKFPLAGHGASATLPLLFKPAGTELPELLLATSLGTAWQPACELLSTPDCAAATARREGDTIESWTEEPGGAHHRFLLEDPDREPLQLRLEVSGARLEQVSADVILLHTVSYTYRYEGLLAVDGSGKVLPSSMEALDDAIVLHVDATGSVGMIDVDPVLSEPDQEILGHYAAARFGFHMGFGGDANQDGFDDVVSGGNHYGFWVPGSAGGLRFEDRAQYTYGNGNPQGSMVAGGEDINGDGVDDFLQQLNGMGHRLLLGVAGAAPVEQPMLPALRWAYPSHVLVGDFNGDGIGDLVRSYHDLSGAWDSSFHVTVTTGGPAIQTTTAHATVGDLPFQSGCNSWDLALSKGDVNGDGFDDLMLNTHPVIPTGEVSTLTWLYLGHPAGIGTDEAWDFTPYDPGTGPGDVRHVAIAPDLNGDGRDDVVMSGDTGVWWLSGDNLHTEPERLGTFVGFYYSASSCGGYHEEYFVHAAGIGDVNGDGYGDIGVTTAPDTKVILGGPDGPLPAPTYDIPHHDGRDEHYIDYIGDVNGDGFDDIAVFTNEAYRLAGALHVYFGAELLDIDSDGVPNELDCGPYRADISPELPEQPGTPDDNNCDGLLACWTDEDGDGHGGTLVHLPVGTAACTDPGLLTTGLDCDDTNPAVHPEVIEFPNDPVDDDCDGLRACHVDRDHDGFGALQLLADCAADPDWTLDDQDCDDSSDAVSPLINEVAGNTLDDDCDGVVACFVDLDGDHAGLSGSWVWSTDDSCEHPGMGHGVDCDEGDPQISPHAEDLVADAIDQDCDGQLLCHVDADGDGFGAETGTALTPASSCDAAGVSSSDDDCDDLAANHHPGAVDEPGNGVDEDCSGRDMLWFDGDEDGYAAVGAAVGEYRPPRGTAVSPEVSSDCDDADMYISPEALEMFSNDIDEDCDGLITCLADADGDGFGACHNTYNHGIPLPSTSSQLTSFCHEYAAFVEIPVGQRCEGTPGVSTSWPDCDDVEPMIHFRPWTGSSRPPVDRPDNTFNEDCLSTMVAYVDRDLDGYGSSEIEGTNSGYVFCDGCPLVTRTGDCDDSNASIHPDRPQDSPTVDTNCNGVVAASLVFTPRPGRRLAVEVLDLPPNTPVQLAQSASAPSSTVCPPTGPCALLSNPTVLAGTTDGNGRAFWLLPLPALPQHGVATWFQAVAGNGPARATAPASWTDGPTLAVTDLGSRNFRVDIMGLAPNATVLLDHSRGVPQQGSCPPTVVCRRLDPAAMTWRGTTDAQGRAVWNLRFPYTVWPLVELHFQAVTGAGPEQSTQVGTLVTPHLGP